MHIPKCITKYFFFYMIKVSFEYYDFEIMS